MRFHLLL